MSSSLIPTNGYINLFHIFLVAPFLLYIANKKNNAPGALYSILMALSIFVLAFHSWRLSTLGANPINEFHILFVVPLLFYIGWKKGMINSNIFRLLYLLAAVIIIFHGWRFYEKYMEANEKSWYTTLTSMF